MLLDLYPYRASAHSGYWRLFFHNLQEESLKKDQEKKIREAANEAVAKVERRKEAESPEGNVPVPKRVERKKRKPTARPLGEKKVRPPVVPFRLAPVKIIRNAYDELAELPPLVFETYLLLQRTEVIINLDVERRKRRRKKIAAILLMAA